MLTAKAGWNVLSAIKVDTSSGCSVPGHDAGNERLLSGC